MYNFLIIYYAKILHKIYKQIDNIIYMPSNKQLEKLAHRLIENLRAKAPDIVILDITNKMKLHIKKNIDYDSKVKIAWHKNPLA